MNALKSIFNILSNDADLVSVVSTRIFPTMIPQKQTKPYISFECYNTEPTNTKQGVSILDTLMCSVSCFHKVALEAITIANLTRTALDRFSGFNADNSIDKIIFDSNDGPYWDEESETFRVDIDFRIRVKVDYGTNPSVCDLLINALTDEQWDCIEASGHFENTCNIYVNGVLDQSFTFNPLVNNTVNITP